MLAETSPVKSEIRTLGMEEGLNGFATHARHDEYNFIMQQVRNDQATLIGRRVDALEYTRINGGMGLHYPTHPKDHFVGNYFTQRPALTVWQSN